MNSLASSSTLQKVVDQVPSSKGVDHIDYRVFLTTNESGALETLLQMKMASVVGNLFVGTSGLFSLNLAALRGVDDMENSAVQLKGILILDCSVRVEAFWTSFAKIMQSESSRVGVIKRIINLVKGEADRYYCGTFRCDTSDDEAILELADFMTELESGVSWLCDNTRFQKVQQIFLNNAFAFKRIDLTDQVAMDRLGQVLRSNQWSVDTLYLSNVFEYLDTTDEQYKFLRSIYSFVPRTAFVIDTVPRGCKECAELKQRVRPQLGSYPLCAIFNERKPFLTCSHP